MYLGSNSCSGPLISKRKKNVIKLYNLKIIELTASFLSFSHFKRDGNLCRKFSKL